MFISTSTLSFRPVQTTDDIFILELFVSARHETFENMALPFEQKQAIARQQCDAMHNSYRTNYPNGLYLIIRHNNEDIGRVYVHESAAELRLLDIIIHPNRRNQGIGSQVMHQLLERAETGKKDFRFYVWINNVAGQNFYRRLGFCQVEQNGPYLLFERRFDS